jgi:hypothetical protein
VPRSLPGADKYRRSTDRDDADAPWNDPLVLRANRDVALTAVLNDYFDAHVPSDAEGWKTYCPFAKEHEDGGLDKQFRVYTSSNSGHCFALHGTLDPVRVWRLRRYFATMPDAARDLLDTYGVAYRRKPYRERMAELRDRPAFTIAPTQVVQTFNVWLRAQPGYHEHQYDQDVLRSVNSALSEVHDLCARARDLEEVELWLQSVKSLVATELTRSSPPRPD